MNDPTNAAPRPRKQTILDPRWQLSVFWSMAGVAIVVCLLQMGANYLLSSLDPLERWSGRELSWLALAANAVFLILVGAGTWIIAMRITHSVVGPAIIIRSAIEGLRRGRFGSRLALRERDYLQDLAASVEQLSDAMKERAETLQKLTGELTRALDQGQVAEALALARKLESLQRPADESETSASAGAQLRAA